MDSVLSLSIALDKRGAPPSSPAPGLNASAASFTPPAAAKDDAAKTTLLAQTLHAQPATVAAALGCYDIFTSAGLKVDAVAGHSLGVVVGLQLLMHTAPARLLSMMLVAGAPMGARTAAAQCCDFRAKWLSFNRNRTESPVVLLAVCPF